MRVLVQHLNPCGFCPPDQRHVATWVVYPVRETLRAHWSFRGDGALACDCCAYKPSQDHRGLN